MNIDMSMKLPVLIEASTLATLIAGLYCTYHNVSSIAVPTSVYIEIVEKLIPFLSKWDYDKLSFEDWVKYGLSIYPREFYSESELGELESSDVLWFERLNGNATLIIVMDMIQ